MENTRRLSISEIENRVCDIVSEQLGIKRPEIHPQLRLIQDLHCDSLDAVELVIKIEDEFDVALPGQDDVNMVYKNVFTRNEFRLADLAELVYLRQGGGRSGNRKLFSSKVSQPARHVELFTQLGGSLPADRYAKGLLFESIGKNKSGYEVHRRLTDGMMCVQIPEANVVIGSDDPQNPPDERPSRQVQIDRFLIDQEPVSTTAYCRFVNSIGPLDRSTLEDWFILSPNDKRQEHELLKHGPGGWEPLPGTERMPMILVSWFGADAYARWANRAGCQNPSVEKSFLPSEAQWEYAARGVEPRQYPWGDDEPTSQHARYGMHVPDCKYRPDQLPMADVNVELGMSPFGLHHMAGNVWQWCNDWYAPNIRSERGGSWVGPGFLCRSSYRRGRIPSARGRCLGFRCVSGIPDNR